jgi:phosphoribosylanthranilate isomerase
MRVKICGITRAEDAKLAVRLGAWGLGFIFCEQSPRNISPEEAAKIIKVLPDSIRTVGVFVNAEAETIRDIQEKTGINTIQLHGDETPEFVSELETASVIKATALNSQSDLDALKLHDRVMAFFIDSSTPEKRGGTGVHSNWKLAREAKQFGNVILSGGLTPDSVGAAIREVGPWAVDVSSGIESRPRIKDPNKMRDFFDAVSKATLQKGNAT